MKKALLFVFIFASLVISGGYPINSEEAVLKFEPLAEDEVLAWQMLYDSDGTLLLYAQDVDNIEQVRLLGKWKNVYTAFVFSDNLKNCFISEMDIEAKTTDVFMINGEEGSVLYLQDITSHGYRSSADGTLVLCGDTNSFDVATTSTFFLYDTEKKSTIKEISLSVKARVGSFLINRYRNSKFEILYLHVDNGTVLAAFTLDPITYDITPLFDYTDDRDYIGEHYTDEKWRTPSKANEVEEE